MIISVYLIIFIVVSFIRLFNHKAYSESQKHYFYRLLKKKKKNTSNNDLYANLMVKSDTLLCFHYKNLQK